VLSEELEQESPYRRFLGVCHKLPLLVEAVSKRRCPAERLTEFGSCNHRGVHPSHNLFSFPLRKGCDQGIEESAGRRRCVDRFGKRNEVGFVLIEVVRKIKQLPGVACKSCELGEDEAGDFAVGDIREHRFGFGMISDRLS